MRGVATSILLLGLLLFVAVLALGMKVGELRQAVEAVAIELRDLRALCPPLP